jgi:uncharacterized protein (TIGR02453 family)
MATTSYFGRDTFNFLRDLADNNDREWFQANRDRFERHVKEPAQRFILDFAEPLAAISKAFVADPRPVGGSMFRIHRDTRFSNDKSPYKTHVGIQFRHHAARDVHAPGFYMHIEPGQSFCGVGIWHPDGKTLKKIRDAIVDSPAAWRRAVGDDDFREQFELGGDSLKRPPRGYEPEHPLIDDLKRKDFIGGAEIADKEVTSADLLQRFTELANAGAPLNRFLCKAVGLPF